MFSISSHQTSQRLSNIVFAVVAFSSLIFWGVELRLAMVSHDARETEVLAAYQQRQLELKADEIRGLVHEVYQTARTISLLPALREVRGVNRKSTDEDVVRQGRLTTDMHRTLQQIYANLSTHTSISEIYFVLDGFDPDRGDVPFFMYDDRVAGGNMSALRRDRTSDIPAHEESAEYAEIRRQLAWFRINAPTFRFGSSLNTIPAVISPLLRTCDNTQFESRSEGNVRDATGFVYSVPTYDALSGQFKGLVAVIVRANVLEAKLLDVPFLPITSGDQERMAADGWQLPPPAQFVLRSNDPPFEIADRRNPLLAQGIDPARQSAEPGIRWATLQRALPGGGVWEFHHYLSAAQSEALAGEIRSAKRLSIAGRALLLIVLSALLGLGFWLVRASRRELLKMAHYDLLTNLPNRRLFFDQINTGMARAQRRGSKMGLFFVDLAGLNAINDRYGHHGGDLLLKKVAQRLQERLQSSVGIFEATPARETALAVARPTTLNFTLFRLGGDEFTILCEDLQAAGELALVAERIIECISEPFGLGDDHVEISLNVGAALYPDDAGDAERLLMSADSAMHECKATHGRYVLFNEEMRQRAEREHRLTLDLVVALQEGQFDLYYQPKAMLFDGHVASMEALIRWHHPSLGLVSPVEFIPILERKGAIVAVGQWIVEQACRDLHLLSAAGHPNVKVSVNVSVHQLRHGFHDFLKAELHSSEVDPGRLILEITETVVIDDLARGRESLLQLKELGVSLAIDDFGAGYSSLTYLQRLPLDSLKIDKSLIDGMVDARGIHVVESVIRLAQGLSLKTIAEGIETEAQRSLILGLGCDMIQGYLLSRPQPLSLIIVWLDERERLAVAEKLMALDPLATLSDLGIVKSADSTAVPPAPSFTQTE